VRVLTQNRQPFLAGGGCEEGDGEWSVGMVLRVDVELMRVHAELLRGDIELPGLYARSHSYTVRTGYRP
jgi:hypothetical protein